MSLQVNIRKQLANFELEVNLEAGAETVGFLGASGCGKSFTLRCIAGVETPDEGRIVVNDRVFFDSAAKINLTPQQRKTALLFQNYQLFPNMTVGENVAAGMDPKLPKAERDELVRKYLAIFSLQGFENRYPLRLSGGQQQRVALARMLAARPEILMLDEPFSALDAHLKGALEQSLLDLFDLYRGTILYVSHDIDEACRFCDRIAVVEDGHIIELGPSDQIVHDPGSLATIKLSGCKNISRCERLGDHVVRALEWDMVFETSPAVVVPEDVQYVGIRDSFIHLIDPDDPAGDDDCNVYTMRVHRTSDSRFERSLTLNTPGGNSHARLWWRLEKHSREEQDLLPVAGNELRLRFEADKFYFVSR